MSFPDTQQTLIQRIATSGDESDWRQFMLDYWGPVCRFAVSRGLSQADAEDVAAQTFEAILTNQLLSRWVSNRAAKLRTLLCAVVRNVLSNQRRIEQGRARLLDEQLALGNTPQTFKSLDAPDDQVDAFYALWVAEVLNRTVEDLWRDYHGTGKGDYYRVLFGRICEEMSMPEIATSLDIPLTSVENYFKAARKGLATRLEQVVRDHVNRYCPPPEQDDEWRIEWDKLGQHLTTHGGLEQVVRRVLSERSQFPPSDQNARISDTVMRILAAPSPSVGANVEAI